MKTDTPNEIVLDSRLSSHGLFVIPTEEPIRAELYGIENLDTHAQWLAQNAKIVPVQSHEFGLMRRFSRLGRELIDDYFEIVEASQKGEVLPPAAEWLLDNFHIIEASLTEIRTDLPRGYYHQLPKLADGSYAGLPRVYNLAVELVAHTDSSLDEGNIIRFVRVYQSVTPLTIGELWAVPIMLRMVLIENLRLLAGQILHTHRERKKASQWITKRLEQLESKHEDFPATNWSDACIVQVLQLLRDHGATQDIESLEKALIDQGGTCGEVLRREHQRQAANQVSVGNCVTSLRLLSNLDWTVFFEKTSLVEERLQQDPVYVHQDFPTKDRYRRRIEQLARGSGLDELEVVDRVFHQVHSSREVAKHIPATSHIGYHLIGPGKRAFEQELHYRYRFWESIVETILDHPGLFYFGSLFFLTLLGVAGCVLYVAREGAEWPILFLTGFIVLLPISELVIGLTQAIITRLLPPRVLPKLEFKQGIPKEYSTFVVIPTLLVKEEGIAGLLERLEVHYLSNPDPNLYFALLTDLTDSSTEQDSRDNDLVQQTLAGIRALNERYVTSGPDRFYLFHRHRLWNPKENCWMGWERKRGKLGEFNRLLRGATDTTYSVQSGDISKLPRIPFVITLDSDTQMPRETARTLISTLAHPLNRPQFDPQRRRVVEGHGILQPRVSLSLLAGTRSLFSRILANSAGIDPYTTAVSDVYQDLFDRGTFTGKGIYDVDAFEKAVGHTFPENHILSHDLIEGNYARCGLITDVELIDDFPAKYHAFARREHRWIRGDWQILPWIFSQVPAPINEVKPTPQTRGTENLSITTNKQANPLPFMERWKILDNLRRSVVPSSVLILLLLAWTVIPGSPWFWVGLSLLVLANPLLLFLGGQAVNLVLHPTRSLRWRDLRAEFGSTIGQFTLSIVFLADQVRNHIDAIVRSLYRLMISHRRLLEWETAAAAEMRLGQNLFHFFVTMWPAPVLAICLSGLFALLGIWNNPEMVLASVPFLLLWLLSPVVAWRVSQPREIRFEQALTDKERRDLRRVARKTWKFFETFVTAEDHWLPPDNYQESPKGQIAHRTSPTNIGLYLLSTLSAHDFGYISDRELLDRLKKTFQTLDELELFHGHFHNWYDTQTKTVLNPAYISTVDSGNLLGCLLALRQGLNEKAQSNPDLISIQEGLRDTFRLAKEAFDSLVTGMQLDSFKEVPESFGRVENLLNDWPDQASEVGNRLEQLTGPISDLEKQLQTIGRVIGDKSSETEAWIYQLAKQAFAWREELSVPTPAAQLLELAGRAEEYANRMDFKILYNQQRNLFSIGYNRPAGRLDQSHYDLLASEACLTSFLAIARGDSPKKHWFQLGRLLTKADNGIALVSWGGTMFEYLMPRIFFRNYSGTLLDESTRGAVARQIEYGKERRVPWGVSESGFNALDAGLDYQYQSFGVPGLGLKRGLARDLVIAPYATGLAVLVCPKTAHENFRTLVSENAEGPFGFYEAIDYTRDRIAGKRRSAVVRSYMAHHQGMIFTALANCLLGEPIVRRFHSEPMVRATELLLQERFPQVVPLIETHQEEETPLPVLREEVQLVSRRLTTANTPHPRTHILSNGQYRVMVTNSGAGSSIYRDLDITRWREDCTTDSYGQFFFLRDTQSGKSWSATHHPLGESKEFYEVIYSSDKAEFRRRDGDIETHTEIVVSPEHPAEIRRLTITNYGHTACEMEVTSYLEIVLLTHRADIAHPAFGKLFLETEWLPNHQALLCCRRPRSSDQKPIWAVHVIAEEGQTSGNVEYETDRARFLGRGQTIGSSNAMKSKAPLSGTTGAVLDPIFSIRRRVLIPADASAVVAFTTLVASSREEALILADRYNDFHGIHRAFELAWAHTRVQLQHLHLSNEDAHLYQRIAGHILYSGTMLRVASTTLMSNLQGQSALWRHGISGDLPIILVRLKEVEELSLFRQLLLAHSYWRLQGIEIDLIILNEHPTSYMDRMMEQIGESIRANGSAGLLDKPGGIFVRRVDHLTEEDRILLLSAARVVLSGGAGSLASQVDRRDREPQLPPPLPGVNFPPRHPIFGKITKPSLLIENGFGGFSESGEEYLIQVKPGQEKGVILPPAPWMNVISNPQCGFIVSESGSGYTWVGNSQTNRLTTWNNDPISDSPSEIIYLRDETNGVFWSPTPLPCGGPCLIRHGFGYSVFQMSCEGIDSELTLFVPPEDPVKIYYLKIRNGTNQSRRLSITFFAEWVLGSTRDTNGMHILTDADNDRTLFARNPFNPDFGSAIAFADTSSRPVTITGDRLEFIGRNGSIGSPTGLRRVELSGRTKAPLDPCAAMMGPIVLRAGEEKEIVIVIGQAPNRGEAKRLALYYRNIKQTNQALESVKARWKERLSVVRVKTPDRGIDLLLNGWLLYQVLSCRVWGRSALYQSGGAYGFRDQLQDVMALVHCAPQETRKQILRAASRQFPEGDVQHWWHPPLGRGVRTRFSDDFLWLPFVVSHYVSVTGDTGILDEQIPFLDGPRLRPDQEEDYGLPGISDETATLLEHCLRAIDHGLQYGDHGLPLIGIGDWNDGMNKVGAQGKGESIWNAWFQLTILPRYFDLAQKRDDTERAVRYQEAFRKLKDAVEREGWDGEWYRRAYFDDGTPLGSSQNPECRIDSIAQSWAVLSGAGDPDRGKKSMEQVYTQLVRKEDRLILLFTPPFSMSDLEPGYIKGYLPGIRENGGQYTHAATWTVMAFARMGYGNRAIELYGILNPIHSTGTLELVNRYKVEPYVVAGDVYGVDPHTGRGGWTWYTGSAGWMYRVALEGILGFNREGDKLYIDPCIAQSWRGFELTYRFKSTIYQILIHNPSQVEKGVISIQMDDLPIDSQTILLIDDGKRHRIEIQMGENQLSN